jgi:hypothetical protein
MNRQFGFLSVFAVIAITQLGYFLITFNTDLYKLLFFGYHGYHITIKLFTTIPIFTWFSIYYIFLANIRDYPAKKVIVFLALLSFIISIFTTALFFSLLKYDAFTGDICFPECLFINIPNLTFFGIISIAFDPVWLNFFVNSLLAFFVFRTFLVRRRILQLSNEMVRKIQSLYMGIFFYTILISILLVALLIFRIAFNYEYEIVGFVLSFYFLSVTFILIRESIRDKYTFRTVLTEYLVVGTLINFLAIAVSQLLRYNSAPLEEFSYIQSLPGSTAISLVISGIIATSIHKIYRHVIPPKKQRV